VKLVNICYQVFRADRIRKLIVVKYDGRLMTVSF